MGAKFKGYNIRKDLTSCAAVSSTTFIPREYDMKRKMVDKIYGYEDFPLRRKTTYNEVRKVYSAHER